MKCGVCGMEYGMTHNCAGARPEIPLPTEAPEPAVPMPSGFLPLYYLREGVRIATWNSDAILKASRDSGAIGYGIAMWVAANSIGLLVGEAALSNGRSPAIDLAVRLIFSLPISAILSLAQVGLCFLLAKWFMGGEGRFVQILRPLLLGSVVFLLLAIPYAGIFLAAIAWICVFAMVFQVVADIEAFSAYALSIVVGLVFREAQSLFSRFLT